MVNKKEVPKIIEEDIMKVICPECHNVQKLDISIDPTLGIDFPDVECQKCGEPIDVEVRSEVHQRINMDLD